MLSKIFLVDDDADDSMFLREALQHAGITQIETFATALDMLRLIETLPDSEFPQLIITDYNLPRLDGFNLASYLKRNSKFSNIKLVVLTGCIHDQDKHRLLNAGVSGIFQKPPTMNEYYVLAKQMMLLAAP